MSGVAEVTACSNQQQKKTAAGENTLLVCLWDCSHLSEKGQTLHVLLWRNALKLWSLWPGECRESAAEPLRWCLNKSVSLGRKIALKSANQVFNMVSGSSKACFDCLAWCGWLVACGEAHSNPDHSPATTDRASSHTHSEYNRMWRSSILEFSVCASSVCYWKREGEKQRETQKEV